jgi:uncharacterized membrane protein
MCKAIILTAVLLVMFDSVYLTIMTPYFNKQITAVQGSKIQMNLLGAILCYVALTAGLYYFIIKDKRSIMDAFLFGLVIYAVYEFTTIALLKNWWWKTVALDTLWGGILFAITTMMVYKIKTLF